MEEFSELRRRREASAAWVREGDVDKGLQQADKVLEMEYTTDMVCHATMEPINATVHQAADGAWHVYTGTQSTSFARMTLDRVPVQGAQQEARGHQGLRASVRARRRLRRQAGLRRHPRRGVLRRRKSARPVKLIQTRESQFATSFPRTPTYHKLKAGMKDGELLAMNHDIVCGWMGPRFSVGKKYGTDWLQLDSWDEKKQDIDQWSIGGSDHWYYVKNHRVRAWNSDRTTWAVQASALRTVSNSLQHVRGRVVHGRGRARGGPRSARVPPGHAQRQGRQPRHSQHRLSAGNTVRLLHGPAVDLAAVAEDRHLASVRVGDGRRRAAAGQLPAGRGRQSGLGLEEAAAEHRHGYRCFLGRRAAESDVGRGRRGGDGRSDDRQVSRSTSSPSRWTWAWRSIRRTSRRRSRARRCGEQARSCPSA